jgi:hypothetical protein
MLICEYQAQENAEIELQVKIQVKIQSGRGTWTFKDNDENLKRLYIK